MDDREIRLGSGRALAWREFGDPQGRPALYFHGFPGSRLEGRFVDDAARKHGVRVLALDRPGYGRSGHRARRTLLDWPDDVAALARELGLDRFSVIGASGGAPYALACALRLPHRLDAVAVVCGLGPFDDRRDLEGMLVWNRLGLLAARRAPWLALPILASLSALFRHRPDAIVSHLVRRIAEADRAYLRSPEARQILSDTFREAFRQGPRGAATEANLYARPWGFSLQDVRAPVHLWHGESDTIVPVAMARSVAGRLPDCRAVFCPGEGHFSLALGRAGELFTELNRGG